MSYTIPQTSLPVEAVLPDLVQALRQSNTAILQAPPGAGKTTTVPLWFLPELKEGQKIIMLEPRRLAARAAARRMADLLGEKVGETVGYRIRLDTKVGPKTRIEVVTEGILTRKLQEDPELADIGLVIFDEFHERNLQTDLGLALSRQCQEILREDLKLLVMSATLDAEAVAGLLDDAPVVTSDGQIFPVETRFVDRPNSGRIEGVIAREVEALCLAEAEGDILIFLPGAGEISRTISNLSGFAKKEELVLLPLFGNLSQKDQDRALLPDPQGRRKIVCATDIAETSLTIEGVRIVVDGGLARAPIFDPGSGMSRLETKRISRASADQRRGRAGRLGPGICLRLWTRAEDRGLIPHSEPEIAVADLAPLALELAKWGVKDVSDLAWMTPPPPGLMGQATGLLHFLGAIDAEGDITGLGQEMVRLPLHPRLARMIIKAEEQESAALACDLAAILSERDFIKTDREAPNADLRIRVQVLNRARNSGIGRPEVSRVLKNADDLRRRFKAGKSAVSMAEVGVLLAFAYPDRVGELRKGSQTTYRLSGGRGASLRAGDALQNSAYIVVADLDGKGRDARIFLAAAISYQELQEQFAADIREESRVYWDAEKDRIVAVEERKIGALVLSEKRLKNPPSDDIAKALIQVVRDRKLRDLPWDAASKGLLDRIAFTRRQDSEGVLWPDLHEDSLLENLENWLQPYLAGKTRLADLANLNLQEILMAQLDWDLQSRLDQFAPSHLTVPTGSKIRLDYSDPERPVLAVRLQELFGQKAIDPIADGKIPVTVHLLSPARRPAQITTDLAGFWTNSYDAVKKDLKGRYPRHYWPDDPMLAEPTTRAKRRK